MSLTNNFFYPGCETHSRSTKRTSSVILSSKEIPYDYRNGKDSRLEELAVKECKIEEKKNDIGSAFFLTQECIANHDSQTRKEHMHYSLKPNTNRMTTGSTSMCSINTQQSQFFHPKYFHEFHNVSSSHMSVAATVDEMEKLPNMEELHNYDKHKQLGTGTDAHVYEVVDRRDKSHVAMKLTKRKSGRYRTEIHLLHQLRTCQYIVKLLKVLEDENVYVLILEQAPMTLEALLHERCTDTPMQNRVGKEIMHDILRGVRAIHSLGFVHKDIKPENILIFADRIHRKLRAKIADFGFATRFQPPQNFSITNIDLPKHTLSEFVERVADKCGTPGFWAPELVAGCVQLKQGFKMDVFSTGVTLYRMVCNEMPFGLFETWDTKINAEDGTKKLSKMKPNFQVVSWLRTTNTRTDSGCKPKVDYLRKLAPTSLSSETEVLLRGMLRIRPHRRFCVDECLQASWFSC